MGRYTNLRPLSFLTSIHLQLITRCTFRGHIPQKNAIKRFTLYADIEVTSHYTRYIIIISLLLRQ